MALVEQPWRPPTPILHPTVSRLTWLGIGLLALLLGCGDIEQTPPISSPDDDDPSPSPTGTQQAPDDLQLEVTPNAVSIRAGESQELSIQVTPAGEYSVLLAVMGQSNGAFVDEDVLLTDTEGQARAELTVPFEGPGFTLRAAVFDRKLEIPVTVRAPVGTLRIVPQYSGQREITEWTVAVLTGESCTTDGTANYNVDFELDQEQTFVVDEDIVLEDVAASVASAVLIRAEHYLFACNDVTPTPGVETQVPIALTARPLQFEDLRFSLRFGFELTAELDTSFRTLRAEMLAPFSVTPMGGTTALDSQALLDGMRVLYGERFQSSGAFSAAAVAKSWNTAIDGYLTERNGQQNPISSSLLEWLRLGLDQLLAPTALEGRLDNGKENRQDRETPFELTLQRVAALAPSEAYVAATSNGTMKNDPAREDALQLAGWTLFWSPSELVASLGANAAGLAEANAMPALLNDELVDCETLWDQLTAQQSDALFDTCDSSCLAGLCQDALGRMWQSARTVRADTKTIAATATAEASIDSRAHPTSFSGSWVGVTNLFGDGNLATPVRGPIEATSTEANE